MKDNGIFYVDKPSDVVSKSYDIDIIAEGRKARKFVEKNDWKKITDEFENTINGVLKDE